MKILVTGGTGMVGRNLTEGLQAAGFKLIAPSRKEMNLFSYAETLEYFSKEKPDFVIHCAGRVGGIQANIANPVSFLVENTDMNRNVILAARAAGVKKMINLGSSCIYPRDAKNPLSEDLILKGELEPTNEGYALAKIFALRLCQYIQKEDPSFKYKTLIPCNLYGPFDKFSAESSHLLPAIIQKIDTALKNQDPEVEIWGDGKARREFMYVGDLVNCVIRAIKQFDSLPDLMNVGLGHDYSVNEYYQAAASSIGFTGKFSHNLEKPVGMKQKLVSVQKLESWGWKSQYSLEQGLKKTVEYYRQLKKV